MNDEKRVALVEGITEALRPGVRYAVELNGGMRDKIDEDIAYDIADKELPDIVEDVMPIIDRLLAERDIDAMLDAVHPQARLNYLGYADFDLCWNAYLWTPDFVATTGTGPTRLEAIADACRKAREGQPRGLREDTTP